MADGLLDVVDENDVVVGQRLRSDIHKEGLRHREVHVWFVTPDRQVIFQRRSPTKESAPNMLDATAGGHVECGQSYLQAALMEVQEETGLTLRENDLVEIAYLKTAWKDTVTTVRNNPFRTSYLHVFRGNVADLAVEAGQGAGFECLPLDAFATTHVGEIVPTLLEPLYAPMWAKMKDYV